MSNVLTCSEEEKLELAESITNLLLLDAFSERASDIHLEPEKDGTVKVKYRIEGAMKDIKILTPDFSEEVIMCLKRLAGLDPETRGIIQKGHIMIKTDRVESDTEFDLMMGILPTIYGDRISLAIKSMSRAQSTIKGGFELLGFKGEDFDNAKAIFGKPFGFMFITGPSGSGKTTTCHGVLNYIKTRTSGKANIIAIEDWIAYPVEGIVQVKVEPEQGDSFYENLKAVMWQDPDVVFVSAVPDRDTAKMICELAFTGHMILLQMDSTDILQAISRLKELGMEPCLLASILEGAIAQRLVRCICEKCKEEYTPEKEIIDRYFKNTGGDKVILYRGKGCEHCRKMGYTGRTGVYEIINPDMDIKDLISADSGIEELKAGFREKGFVSLREKALSYALSGVTTLEEALRVSYT